MNARKSIQVATIAALASIIAACSSGSDPSQGTISVSLMDRPVDGITELNITVTEFWIKPQGNGPAFQLDMVETPVTVNLLELSVDNPAIFIERANIPAGTYNWLEMTVDDSNSSASHAMTDAMEVSLARRQQRTSSEGIAGMTWNSVFKRIEVVWRQLISAYGDVGSDRSSR